MDKYEELACEIIDKVCDVIEEHYPELKPRHITDDDSIEDPSLINGTVYYDLENEIAERLRNKLKDDAAGAVLDEITRTTERRRCDACNKEMLEGYCIGGGEEYYCSDECLHTKYTDEEFAEMYADGEGDSYYTTWEDDDDE